MSLEFSCSESIDKYYRTCSIVGEGAFGVVRKAERLHDTSNSSSSTSSRYVAIKQMKPSRRSGVGIPQDVYREIKLLKELKHDNIVTLERVFVNADGDDDDDGGGGSSSLYLVYTYVERDLSEVIRFHRKTSPCPMRMVRSIVYQILSGLKYMHENWVMHRDIKPANILVCGPGNDEQGRVKIADLGLARIFQGVSEVRKLADDGDVVTIWYRAPELLLSANHYTPAIDVWAAGCIFAELLISTPIFMGKEEKAKVTGDRIPFQASQLRCIFKVLGKPTPKHWPLIIECPFYERMKGWSMPEVNVLAKRLPKNVSADAVDLLNSMLIYDPKKRITCAEALQHEFFSSLQITASSSSSGAMMVVAAAAGGGGTKRHATDEAAFVASSLSSSVVTVSTSKRMKKKHLDLPLQ